MAQVVVRNLDDGVVDTLRQRARRERKSLEQLLRDGITAMAREDRIAWLEELDRIRAAGRAGATGGQAPLAEEIVREERERR